MTLEYHNYTWGYTESSSVSGSAPAGFVQDDIFIAVAFGGGGSHSLSIPSGWTLVKQQERNSVYGDWTINVSYRIAQTGDTNWSWAFGGGVASSIAILRYTGQSLTSPFPFSGGGSGYSSTMTAPAVSYNGVNLGSLTLQVVGGRGWYDGGLTTPVQLTQRYNRDHVYIEAAGGDKAVAGTGSTGTAGFTRAGAYDWASITVVIQAAKTFVPTINIF